MLGFRPPVVVVPPGDPGALLGAARVLQRTAQRSDAGGTRLQSVAAGLADGWTWCGPRASAYLRDTSTLTGACRVVGGALQASALAVQAYAHALAEVQALARGAQQQAEQLDRACTSLEWRLAAAADTGPPSGDAAQQARAAAQAQAHRAALQREAEQLRWAVAGVHAQVQQVEELVAAAERALTARLAEARQALDATAPPPAAPAEPSSGSWYDSPLHHVGGFFRGVYDGVADPVKMAGGLVGVGDADASDSWKAFGSGLAHGVRNPGDLGKALIGWDDLAAGEYGHWAGELVPGVVAAFYTGGASAVTRSTKGVTALQKAGLSVKDVERLTEAQAAQIIMRGAKEQPGSISAGTRIPDQDISWPGTPASMIDGKAVDFTGPVRRVDLRRDTTYYVNGHDGTQPLTGPDRNRSLFWGASPRDALAVTSTQEYVRRWALPDAPPPAGWGPRNQMTVVRLPAGHQGPVWHGATAPKTSYGEQFSGGAPQQLHHTLRSDYAVWSGPLPWEPVRDLPGAVRHGATGAAVGAGVHVAAVSTPDASRQTEERGR